MGYKSNLIQVQKAFNAAKGGICNGIGVYVVAEMQQRTTVLTGNLKRSETYEVMDDNIGINVGATADAPYGIYVEKGTSKMPAQPFCEPAVMDNINQLASIANEQINLHLGVS